GKFAHRPVPILVVRLPPLEEKPQDVHKFLRFRDLAVKNDEPILDQNRVRWGLKENVRAGVSGGELLVHLRLEVVLFVFGLPVAARQIEGVEDGRVHAQGAFAGARNLVLADDQPLEGAGALLQQTLEGAAEVALVVEFAPSKLLQRLVVGLDRSVGRLELECAHGSPSTLNASHRRELVGTDHRTCLDTTVSTQLVGPRLTFIAGQSSENLQRRSVISVTVRLYYDPHILIERRVANISASITPYSLKVDRENSWGAPRLAHFETWAFPLP